MGKWRARRDPRHNPARLYPAHPTPLHALWFLPSIVGYVDDDSGTDRHAILAGDLPPAGVGAAHLLGRLLEQLCGEPVALRLFGPVHVALEPQYKDDLRATHLQLHSFLALVPPCLTSLLTF